MVSEILSYQEAFVILWIFMFSYYRHMSDIIIILSEAFSLI
jgi:hypothetical protein